MCCPGCRAVASLIASSGLGNFYQQRTAYNVRPESPEPEALQQYLIYDDPDLYSSFCQPEDGDKLSARLLLGGVTCAACTWLIEQSLGRLPGVQRAQVNLQQSRLDIRFDPATIPLLSLIHI